MSEWKPMSANPFPWEHTDVMVAAFDKNMPSDVQVFRCVVAEHGAHFPLPRGGMISLNEGGWVPFAWRDDDTPARDDAALPPMWKDYLTGAD